MSGGAPGERRLVYVDAGGKANRPGIALCVWDDGTALVAFVAFGTGTCSPEYSPEVVPVGSPEATCDRVVEDYVSLFEERLSAAYREHPMDGSGMPACSLAEAAAEGWN